MLQQPVAMVLFSLQGVLLQLSFSCVESLRISRPPKTATIEELNAASARCKWSWFRCKGEGCKYRPLPLDHKLSQSCRLTDDYMLHDQASADKFIELNANLLLERSESFQEECANRSSGVSWLPGSGWFQKKRWHCMRHAGHIMRASKLLMSQAAQEKLKDIDQLRSLAQHSLEKALVNLATSFGSDGQYVLKLLEKLKSGPTRVTKDLKGSLSMVVDNLLNLAGDEAEKEQARAAIDSMPADVEADPSQNDIERLAEVADELAEQISYQNASEKVEKIVSAITKGTNTDQGSLMQMAGEGDDDSDFWETSGTTTTPVPLTGFQKVLQLPLKVNWIAIMLVGLTFALVFAFWLWPAYLYGLTGLAAWFGTGHWAITLTGAIPSLLISQIFQRWSTAAHKHQDPNWAPPPSLWEQLTDGGGGYSSSGLTNLNPNETKKVNDENYGEEDHNNGKNNSRERPRRRSSRREIHDARQEYTREKPPRRNSRHETYDSGNEYSRERPPRRNSRHETYDSGNEYSRERPPRRNARHGRNPRRQ